MPNAASFADLDTLVLTSGGHYNPDAGLCVMEAVAYFAHEPHSDHPACVSPILGAFLRRWNDDLDDAGRQRLKAYIPRLIGTAGDPAADDRRGWMLTDWMVRVHTPAWLRLAGLEAHAAELEQTAALWSLDDLHAATGPLDRARKAGAAARDAARAAARAAARGRRSGRPSTHNQVSPGVRLRAPRLAHRRWSRAGAPRPRGFVMCLSCVESAGGHLVEMTTELWDLAGLIWDWYHADPNNETGGALHVQLDDMNLDDCFLEDNWWRGFAADGYRTLDTPQVGYAPEVQALGQRIVEQLRAVPEDVRHRVVHEADPYRDERPDADHPEPVLAAWLRGGYGPGVDLA